MNIVMITNTYLPHVGGVARSVDRFTEGYRKRGHRVLVVAPEFEGQDEHEKDVVRVPAVQDFNGSDFSLVVPIPLYLKTALNEFEPDIIHAHHPFLLGVSALRAANARKLPLVFTHHTMYEQYSHYVPVEAPNMSRFVIQMCTDYANRCDAVITPSESIRDILLRRGVETPIQVIPTGVNVDEFHKGNGPSFREAHDIPAKCLLLGHLGRLAPEKNLTFLARAVSAFLQSRKRAYFLVVGTGPSAEEMKKIFSDEGVVDRVRWAGKLTGQTLVDAYHAMDLFVFSSKSETQGMVLVEALAAGTPLVALDAPGAREVVKDRVNGRLVEEESAPEFVRAINWYARKKKADRAKLKEAARRSAESFSTDRCVDKALALYDQVMDAFRHTPQYEESEWMALLRAIEEEWSLWTQRMSAAADLLFEDDEEEAKHGTDSS